MYSCNYLFLSSPEAPALPDPLKGRCKTLHRSWRGSPVQQSPAPQQAEREGGAPPEVEALHPALQDPSRRECGAVQLGVGNSTFASLKTNNTTEVIAAHPVIAIAVIRRNLRVFILVKQ